jgi:hypothetical protein
MWDKHTTRVVVTRNVIWLKRLFFQNDVSGVLEPEGPQDIWDDLGLGLGLDIDGDISANHLQTKSSVMT